MPERAWSDNKYFQYFASAKSITIAWIREAMRNRNRR
jgi:hypothetical protein